MRVSLDDIVFNMITFSFMATNFVSLEAYCPEYVLFSSDTILPHRHPAVFHFGNFMVYTLLLMT